MAKNVVCDIGRLTYTIYWKYKNDLLAAILEQHIGTTVKISDLHQDTFQWIYNINDVQGNRRLS